MIFAVPWLIANSNGTGSYHKLLLDRRLEPLVVTMLLGLPDLTRIVFIVLTANIRIPINAIIRVIC